METQNFILDGCKREVVITMHAAELEPHYSKAYAEAQPHIELQGFRKGKVPLHIIKKKFGKVIENDAVETIANDGFAKFIESENVNPVGRPSLKDIQRDTDGSIKFTIAYEVLPEFELANYRGLELRKPVHPITDADVDREMEELTMRYGKTEPAEQITDEMFIAKVQFRRLDEQTGLPILGGEAEEFTVFLKREPADSEVKAALLNAKVGDTFNYLMPDRDNPDVKHRTIATVNEIQRVIPAELSNEFVEQVTGGKHMTTEELREEYERQIKEFWQDLANRTMNDQITAKMLEAHDFVPPQALVQEVITNILKQEVERLPNKKLPQGFDIQRYVERITPMATNTAKWMIIRERIIEAENLTVGDDDIDKHVNELADMVGSEANFEYLRSLVAGNPEIQHRLLNDKVMEVLRDYAVITEVADTEFANEPVDA